MDGGGGGGEREWGQGERLHAETAQSALTVILKLVIWPASSCLKDTDLQFQGWFVPVSLWPVLWIVAAHVLGTVRSSRSQLLHWGFSVYKTAHRMWLRILSTDPEKELKALDDAYWQHYYCLVSSVFLSLFLISLIKLAFWLKLSTGKRQKENVVVGVGGKDDRVLLCFKHRHTFKERLKQVNELSNHKSRLFFQEHCLL